MIEGLRGYRALGALAWCNCYSSLGFVTIQTENATQGIVLKDNPE
jgi:hypothetical protein